MNQQTSKIVELRPVQSLSFSDYAHMSPCLVASWPSKRVVLESEGVGSAPSRAVVVGRFYHDMLKALDDLYDLGHEDGVRQIRSVFADLLNTYRLRYADLDAGDLSAFDYWPEITAIVRSVIEIFELDLEEGVRPKREESIKSANLKIHGVIDELVELENAVLVTEYKTTQDEIRLREERHVEQVHFYSLLVNEHFGKPVKARIRGLLGASIDVPIDDDRLVVMLRRVNEFFRRAGLVRQAKSIAELCDVSSRTCPNCPHALSCPVILESVNPSIGKGADIAVVDEVSQHESEMLVRVVSGTVPAGERVLVGAGPKAVLPETKERLIISGLTYAEGRLRTSASSRIAKIVQS